MEDRELRKLIRVLRQTRKRARLSRAPALPIYPREFSETACTNQSREKKNWVISVPSPMFILFLTEIVRKE